MNRRQRDNVRAAAVRFTAGKVVLQDFSVKTCRWEQMNHDKINQWIRWQRCKVTLGMAAQYLCIASIPFAIIVWIVSRCARP
jgi:hypothetical protein